MQVVGTSIREIHKGFSTREVRRAWLEDTGLTTFSIDVAVTASVVSDDQE
jgi:hypothetical protein